MKSTHVGVSCDVLQLRLLHRRTTWNTKPLRQVQPRLQREHSHSRSLDRSSRPHIFKGCYLLIASVSRRVHWTWAPRFLLRPWPHLELVLAVRLTETHIFCRAGEIHLPVFGAVEVMATERLHIVGTTLFLRQAHFADRGRVPRGVFLDSGDILVPAPCLGIAQEPSLVTLERSSAVSLFLGSEETAAAGPYGSDLC